MDWNTLNRKQKLVSLLLVAGVIFFLYLSLGGQARREESSITAGASNQENVGENTSYYVEITGHVKLPGVYELDRPMLVLELIELAGGATFDADLNYIHKDLALAKLVEPEQKIYLPRVGAVKISDSGGSSGAISLNTASAEELTTLPGIGPATAEKIISGRPYSQLADLKEVSGIGEATYNKIVTLVKL